MFWFFTNLNCENIIDTFQTHLESQLNKKTLLLDTRIPKSNNNSFTIELQEKRTQIRSNQYKHFINI